MVWFDRVLVLGLGQNSVFFSGLGLGFFRTRGFQWTRTREGTRTRGCTLTESTTESNFFKMHLKHTIGAFVLETMCGRWFDDICCILLAINR